MLLKFEVMKWTLILLVSISLVSCEKKAVEVDPEWAYDWVYAYDDAQTLSIRQNGFAVYDTKRGKHRGYARIQETTFKIGLTGRFLILKTPKYNPSYNRWEMEIDNMQFLHY
jgi:hypothetical protein